MTNGKKKIYTTLAFISVIMALSPVLAGQQMSPARQAENILKACDIRGGLLVHIGCGDARLTEALCAGPSYLVHGLDRSAKRVAQARQYLHSRGVYGNVSVDQLEGDNLPYIDNLVNLVVSENLGTTPMSEVMRILCPNLVLPRWTRLASSDPSC